MRLISRLWGGLGNQLFIYASSGRSPKGCACRLRFDVTHFSIDIFERIYLLDQLGITIKRATRLESFAVRGGKHLRNLVSSREERRPVERRRYIREVSASDCRKLECQTRRRWLYIEGYWQDFRFFDHNRGALSALVQQSDAARTAHSVLGQHARPILGIHVRQQVDRSASGVKVGDRKPILNQEYYLSAMRIAMRETPIATILLFGDDIEFRRALAESIQKHYPAEVKIIEGFSPVTDLLTLVSCDALVLSCSTFAWWGGYLNLADRFVIHPGLGTNGEPFPTPRNWRTTGLAHLM
jgi:hypothetical protein